MRLSDHDAADDPAALHHQLEAMRPALLRFALLQLRNESAAEDAVQDALIAVLERPRRFEGRSSLRTYVTGIMKHKIIDALRSAGRERPLGGDADESDDGIIDALFARDGHACTVPLDWGDPGATLERHDFFRIMEMCLDRLPPNMARMFLMREWLELDTAEICRELGCSQSNACVLLYRARLRLRECLDLHWFGKTPGR
jgi:RNA polymerase sigma-70 factor, ECF subfamily